jgi:hypothetical protein
MFVTTLVVTGMLVWVLATMLIDARRRRPRRPDLTERLRPFQPSIGDEAERWLRRQP